MRRKQLYIDEDLDRSLKQLALRTGRSEAEHVRLALRMYLEEHFIEPAEDPLLAISGLVGDPEGPDDVAEEHDHYLYGAPKAGT